MNETPPGGTILWDVIAVLLYAVAVIPLQWIPFPSTGRIVLVTPILLFVPGYALTTVLFPGRPIDDGAGSTGGAGLKPFASGDYQDAETSDDIARLGIIERAAISVGLSVALLPLFAFAFDAIIGEIVGPVIVVAAVFSTIMILIGRVRRTGLPESDRHVVPIGRWFDEITGELTRDSTGTAAANVVLAISVVLAVGAVGIAFAVPQEGASFTDLSVGTMQDGEFVTDEYPDDIQPLEVTETAVLIENNEGESMEYTVVARFERVQDETVVSVEDAGRFTVTLDAGETAIENHSATPSMTGTDVRLRFLLYRGEPPADPRPGSAYRSVHVWIDVE